jgi:hypothetical protein
MLIQCLAGPVTTEVMGSTYNFVPNEDGKAVVEVWDPKHIQCFLNVVHYIAIDPETGDPLFPTTPPGTPPPAVPLVLEDIDPDSAEIGSADLTLTLTGTGFTGDSVIVFNGGDEPTTFVSDTELTTIVKPSTAGTEGDFPVLVRNAGEQSAALDFTFTAAGVTRTKTKAPAAKAKARKS